MASMNNFVGIVPKGTVTLDPSHMSSQPTEQTVAVGQEKSKRIFKNTDHHGVSRFQRIVHKGNGSPS